VRDVSQRGDITQSSGVRELPHVLIFLMLLLVRFWQEMCNINGKHKSSLTYCIPGDEAQLVASPSE